MKTGEHFHGTMNFDPMDRPLYFGTDKGHDDPYFPVLHGPVLYLEQVGGNQE